MNPEKPLSISDIAGELNSGIVTLKFILKRFRPWLPFDRIDGHHYYSRNTIPVLIKIQASLAAGLLPSEIDQELKIGSQESLDPKKGAPINSGQKMDRDFPEHPNEDIRVSKEGLTLIKSLFDDIAILQNRVATAHEKRVTAEERKAAAIEKRAEAEEKKAIAMNNIANALQEMNHHRRLDSPAREMVHMASQALTLDETNQDLALADLEDTGDTQQQDYPEIFDSPDPPIDLLEASEIQMDDLSDLIQTIEIDPQLDDLAALVDQGPPPVNPAKKEKEEEEVSEIDDLSLLLEPIPDPVELDDLSLLIEAPTTEEPHPPVDMDDLSLLITPDAMVPDSLPPMDDPIDDPMDDLGALISDPPSLRPDITPEENLKEYKAAVMKIILDLKTENLSAQETTRRLNQDGVQTISGKSQWSEAAISQIYKFIDSAT